MKFSSRSALSSKNFRIYFYGNILSVVGIWVQRLSLGWHAWQLSESAFIVGLVAAAQYLPLLLLTPFFGVFADQYKPRIGAIVMHVILMCVALILSFLTFMESMDVKYLVILSLFYGIANSAYSPIRLALIPVLVPSSQFSSAVAITSAGFNLSRFLGPGIAGFIVTFYGLGFAYFINAITFLPVIFALLIIKIPLVKSKSKLPESYFQKLREGFRYTLNHELIRNVILIAGISSFFGRGIIELLPAFAVTIFSGGSDTLAKLMAASGFGAVIASLIYMTGILDLRLRQAVLYGGYGMAISCMLFAITENISLGIVIVALIGFFITFVAVGSQSQVQVKVANELRGRVSSLWTIIVLGGPALGSLVAGLLVNEFGAQPTVIVFSSICILCLVFIQWRQTENPNQSP
ncbi:MAG: MFS transporter [Woeseiaceae bacterium]|nr:MFS transporter [Woeseiaceae bacterium]